MLSRVFEGGHKVHAVDAGPARVGWTPSGRGRAEDFLLGRSLIDALLASTFAEVSGWRIGSAVCARCGERHGAVELAGVAAVASVSYTSGLVVAAVAPSAAVAALGVDVEVDEADDTRTADLLRLLGPSGDAVLLRWTRIEAVLKADGRGLLVDPGAVRFDGDTATILDGPDSYHVRGIAGPAGFVISLAWRGAGSSAASPGRATG